MAAQKLALTVLKNSANLKALYEFESGALTTDSSGNNNTLTNNGTVTTEAGKYGHAAIFNGSDQSLSIASNYSIGITNWSVSCWVKTDSASQEDIIWYIGTPASSGFGLFQRNVAGGAGNAIDGLFGGVTFLGNATTFPDTTNYHHLVLTRDTTTYRIYVNGICVKVGTTTPITPSASSFIGGDGTYWFDGKVDDFALFVGQVLSADQIKELYEGRFIGESYPQAGLVGGWHLNGSSTDFSGNNNHGTDTAITYSQANGKFGQGAGFNGTSSVVSLAATNLPSTSTARTISVWANFTAQPAANGAMYMVNWGAVSNNNLSAFIYADTGGTKYLALAGYANDGVVNYTLSNSVWYHLAVTYSGTTVTIYVNGKSIGTATVSAFNTSTTGAALGRPYWDTSAYFSGKLDEILIFNRALSAQEIRRMYAVGTGKYY